VFSFYLQTALASINGTARVEFDSMERIMASASRCWRWIERWKPYDLQL